MALRPARVDDVGETKHSEVLDPLAGRRRRAHVVAFVAACAALCVEQDLERERIERRTDWSGSERPPLDDEPK